MKHFLLTLFIVVFSNAAYSQVVEETLAVDDILCPNSKIIGKALITDVCWEGMFPLHIGSKRVTGKAKFAPPDRTSTVVCACSGNIEKGILPVVGSTTSMYLPRYLLTVTKKPYCFPELNGTELASQLGLVSRFNVGNEDWSNGNTVSATNQASYSWHLAALPLTRILELFENHSCFKDGYSSYSLLWLSETLAPWYDPELAFFVAPESALFSSPLALAGMVTDCVASSAINSMDTIFWAAGCWGGMYPLQASIGSNPDKVAGKSLIATRALFFLSRIGMLERTMGNDALCERQKMPLLKKTMYRFQQLWPMSESESMDVICENEQGCDAATADTTLGPEKFASNVNANNIEQIKMNSLNETCTHRIGETTLKWGMWRDAQQPDHASYLIFQWADCCLDLIP